MDLWRFQFGVGATPVDKENPGSGIRRHVGASAAVIAPGAGRGRRPRRGLVTSFPLWVECYAALVATLSTRYPEKMRHFMAYLRTITTASRNFEDTAWALYDMAFRRQAANQRSLDWGVIDSALYNEAFTGRAQLIPRCRFCLADTHDSRE